MLFRKLVNLLLDHSWDCVLIETEGQPGLFEMCILRNEGMVSLEWAASPYNIANAVIDSIQYYNDC